MLKYLGAYKGNFLFERDGQTYKQFNDFGFQEAWREQSITEAEAKIIRARGREELDMVFRISDANIPPGVKPIWRTHPKEYLTWHRDHDPSPYREEAEAALKKLERPD